MVAGVDGCRNGWVVALGPTGSIFLVRRFADVLRLRPRPAVIAVDMPIGLPEGAAPRACDIEARQRLGPRRSSVFPAPSRACLGASSYGEALARSREACGRGLSQQAFHLLPKLAEVDAAVTPARQRRIVEASPELAFALLLGGPALHPKRTAPGRAERVSAVVTALGLTSPPTPVRGAAMDDVLDAVVLTAVARRVLDGTAERLGDGSRDRRGLRMEIVL
jgi:predicted RNase H-like nuclease